MDVGSWIRGHLEWERTSYDQEEVAEGVHLVFRDFESEYLRPAYLLDAFWDIVKHMKASRDIASEDASSGNLTGSIAESVRVVRELTNGELGEDEPLLRARFIDYLRRKGA